MFAMATNSTPTPNRPRGSFQFRLIHLLVAITWISVWLGAIIWLEISFPFGVCLGGLIVAIVYDRHLTNASRLMIALPFLAYLFWWLMPKIH